MTPKEKAEELVLKFKELPQEGTLMFYVSFEIGKQCALIAVDEILKSGCTFPSNNTYYGCNEEASEYWLEVKSELEKL